VRIAACAADLVEGSGDGVTLRARGAGADGARAIMAIRPEDIRLGRPADGINALRGTIEIVEYLGREQEALVRLDERTRIWLRTADMMAPGQQVDLTLPADKIVVLPAGQDP
jgi:putative spermidine/putrescine transport system ATP-binding protein